MLSDQRREIGDLAAGRGKRVWMRAGLPRVIIKAKESRRSCAADIRDRVVSDHDGRFTVDPVPRKEQFKKPVVRLFHARVRGKQDPVEPLGQAQCVQLTHRKARLRIGQKKRPRAGFFECVERLQSMRHGAEPQCGTAAKRRRKRLRVRFVRAALGQKPTEYVQ